MRFTKLKYLVFWFDGEGGYHWRAYNDFEAAKTTAKENDTFIIEGKIHIPDRLNHA